MKDSNKYRKHYKGCYRTHGDNGLFGQIKKKGSSEWHADIRDVKTGDLVRPAGIWNTRKDAYEEIDYIIKQQS